MCPSQSRESRERTLAKKKKKVANATRPRSVRRTTFGAKPRDSVRLCSPCRCAGRAEARRPLLEGGKAAAGQNGEWSLEETARNMEIWCGAARHEVRGLSFSKWLLRPHPAVPSRLKRDRCCPGATLPPSLVRRKEARPRDWKRQACSSAWLPLLRVSATWTLPCCKRLPAGGAPAPRPSLATVITYISASEIFPLAFPSVTSLAGNVPKPPPRSLRTGVH